MDEYVMVSASPGADTSSGDLTMTFGEGEAERRSGEEMV